MQECPCHICLCGQTESRVVDYKKPVGHKGTVQYYSIVHHASESAVRFRSHVSDLQLKHGGGNFETTVHSKCHGSKPQNPIVPHDLCCYSSHDL